MRDLPHCSPWIYKIGTSMQCGMCMPRSENAHECCMRRFIPCRMKHSETGLTKLNIIRATKRGTPFRDDQPMLKPIGTLKFFGSRCLFTPCKRMCCVTQILCLMF